MGATQGSTHRTIEAQAAAAPRAGPLRMRQGLPS
jgi:hypothetical protein